MEGAVKLETNRALTFVRDSPKACKNDEVRVHGMEETGELNSSTKGTTLQSS